MGIICTDDVLVLIFFKHCCAAAYVRPACPCRRWIRFTLILVRLQCHQQDYCVSRPICLLQSMFTKSVNMSWLPSIAFVQKNEPRKHWMHFMKANSQHTKITIENKPNYILLSDH